MGPFTLQLTSMKLRDPGVSSGWLAGEQEDK